MKIKEKPFSKQHFLFPHSKTFGQKAADEITKWAGSWVFILSFSVFLILWMVINTAWVIFRKSWDPYPFILLNLILSSLAAFQAPIILMSQNRGNERDRIKTNYDYLINRKSEREIESIREQLNRIEKKLKEVK